ncbi:MauE/DoxX family redox-associated membrane protein [Planctomonas deserti]|uniref:MauE/DoxX family redox-associated membrane protein n=1 Tax=Planctomonas deserti TaxID=2144185 RepID=UPI000D3CF433|nr:MauE/DoxX family redox-associated membrane protein [Planctomonas deserti]
MFAIVIAATLGGLLLLAGVSKLHDREGGLAAVQGYRLLPRVAERIVAITLPYVEILIGVPLLLGLGAPVVPAAAAVLFLVFFAALSINLLRGRRELDCGCFGFAGATESAPRITWFHAGRALALAVLAAALLLIPGGYGIGATPLVEHLLGVALALLIVSIGLATFAVRAVVHPRRHRVDVHLSRARAHLHAGSSLRP